MNGRKAILLSALLPVASYGDITLEEVEVKAGRELLTESDVRESFTKDPGEALTRIEGVWKIRRGAIASDTVIRGFGRSNINVLYDGARIYGACPNRMDPPAFHVDFAEVKEISVIKGPFDIRNYGSVGGTVNIKTSEPGRGLRVKFHFLSGSFSYINPSLNLSYGEGKYYVLAGYSYRYSKPYRTGEGRRFTEYADYKANKIDSTAFSINTFWTKVGVRPSQGTKLELSYTGQRARDVLYPYLTMDSPEDNADRFNLKIELGALRVSAYFSYIDHLMNNAKRTSPTFMETAAKTSTYGTKAEYRAGRFTVGLEAFLWNWEAKTKIGAMPVQYVIPDVDLVNIGLFGEWKTKLPEGVKVVAGLRLDHTQTSADRDKANTNLYSTYHGTTDTEKSDTYPSGNVRVSYGLGKRSELFVGLGYAVRVPDAQERYFALNRPSPRPDWVGNPSLRPSKNTELDIGFNWKSPKINAQLTFFYSYVEDFITVYKINTARSYTNVDATFHGGEFSSSLALSDKLFMSVGVSYVRGKKETDPAKNIRDEDVAEVPPLKARLSLRYDAGTYFGEMEGIAQATQEKTDSDLNETKTSGWGVINMRAGAYIGGFRIVVGVENLLDKFYYEHLSYLRDPFSSGVKVPEPGRNFYVSLSYVF